VGKSLGSSKGQKAKGVANKGSATKSTLNQPNAMEAQFARLEVLAMNMASNMVAQVEHITHVPNDSLTHGFDPRFFYGARFLRPLGPYEIESSIHDVMF
jgi:hypothetical protein